MHRAFSEIRFVGQVASERGVVAEDDVLHHRLPRAHRLEEIPEMRLQIVVVVAVEGDGLRCRFLARLGIVFLVPLFEVRFAQAAGKEPV